MKELNGLKIGRVSVLQLLAAACIIGLVIIVAVVPWATVLDGQRFPQAQPKAMPWHINYGPDEGQKEAACFGNKRILVLGDSQMFHVARSAAEFLECSLLRSGGRCRDGAQYLGIPERANIVMPDAKSGPIHYGLEHINEGCRDCLGCDAMFYECILNENQTKAYVEYIAVEFARDFTIQGEQYTTTQENIILGHLQRNPTDFVAFNTGLHDTALNDSSPATYAKNLEWYVSLFSKLQPAPKLIFLSTTPVTSSLQPEKYQEITENQKIYEYNKLAANIMRRHGASFIDVWPLLRLRYWQEKVTDGVHFFKDGLEYYHIAAWLVLSVACDYIKVSF